MTTYKWFDLGDNVPFFGDIARGTRGFICQLWSKYPDRFTYGKNAATAPAKFFWNKVCEEENINEQPPPPDFEGGQCNTVYYFVYVKYLRTNCSNNTSVERTIGPYDMYGPIRSVNIDNLGSCEGPKNLTIKGKNASGGDRTLTILVDGEGAKVENPQITITRPDGLPDNCGNLPSTFPPTQPPLPGQETYNVTINDGSDVNLNIPLIWNKVDFNMPITFDFDAGDASVDIDGIDINLDIDNDWNLNKNPDSDGFQPSDRNTSDNINNTVNNINTTINLDRKPFEEDDFDSEENPPAEEEEVEDKFIDFVQVNVVGYPKDGKIILNKKEEDTFFWAGYFCWTVDGARTTHVVIQKLLNIYKKPSWATGYALFSVNGAVLQTTMFKKKVM